MSRVEQTPGNEDPAVHKEPLMVHGESIPTLLKEYPQWVCWRYVYQKKGRPLKVPVNPHSLYNAGVNWPNTWGTFEQAFAAYHENSLGGLGFVLTQDDPFVGVDLDGCVEDDMISPAARVTVAQLCSYTEVSPSGEGLHILAASPGYQESHKTKTVEVYSHSRFLTVTGAHVAYTPVDINSVDPRVLQSLLPPPSPAPSPTPHEAKPFAGTDTELWELIFRHDRYGSQHQQRFNGDISLDHGDHSLATIRILNTLARWTGSNAARMRSMALMSPLVNNKWFSKRGDRDWLDYQIADAIRYAKGGK